VVLDLDRAADPIVIHTNILSWFAIHGNVRLAWSPVSTIWPASTRRAVTVPAIGAARRLFATSAA
jgi:hypothetical protein